MCIIPFLEKKITEPTFSRWSFLFKISITMAHSSWQLPSSSNSQTSSSNSQTSDPNKVTFVLNELPSDKDTATEEKPNFDWCHQLYRYWLGKMAQCWHSIWYWVWDSVPQPSTSAEKSDVAANKEAKNKQPKQWNLGNRLMNQGLPAACIMALLETHGRKEMSKLNPTCLIFQKVYRIYLESTAFVLG